VTDQRQSATVVVCRDYRPETGACERAVALLLEKQPVSKQGGSTISRPDNTKVRATDD
jgi:hypothetical protein